MTINDIEQVKKALIPLSETLKYTELIQAIDKCNGLYKNVKCHAPSEDRTHDLKIMRLTRCLLRHRGI